MHSERHQAAALRREIVEEAAHCRCIANSARACVLVCEIQARRDVLKTCCLASRRDGEQDRETGRSGPRGAGGEDGRQPGEEFHRAGVQGAGEPAFPLPQVPGCCLLL